MCCFHVAGISGVFVGDHFCFGIARIRGLYQLVCFLAAACVLTIYLTRVQSQETPSQSVRIRSAVKEETQEILPQFGQYKENRRAFVHFDEQ